MILGLKPFCFIERPSLRVYVRRDPASNDSLMICICFLTPDAKKNSLCFNRIDWHWYLVDGRLGQHTTLVFFATYLRRSSRGCSRWLLSFLPFGNETSLFTDSHAKINGYVLGLSGKTWQNGAVSSKDSCDADRSLSRKGNIRMVGCHGHGFSQAMQDIFCGLFRSS